MSGYEIAIEKLEELGSRLASIRMQLSYIEGILERYGSSRGDSSNISDPSLSGEDSGVDGGSAG
jgi:hypothetical protein